MEPHIYPCPTNHYLSSHNFLEPFLYCMLHYIHFQQYIEPMYLEHVLNDKLVHLDKKIYMLLYFYQYMGRFNQRIPSIGSQF